MKNIIVKHDITIRKAMKTLDKTAKRCLLVIDEDKKLIGTLTDGDIRRSILNGTKFSESISSAYNTKPTFLIQGKYNLKEAEKLLRDLKLDLIPIINDNRIVIDCISLSGLSDDIAQKQSSLKDVSVVIMAGGKGKRMQPFTTVLPKPLIPVQEKPIIEHIIDRFKNLGCSNYHITINYKGKILKAYFDELDPDYKVSFIKENDPLGTAGSLQFLNNEFSKPFFVTNCDIIINTDYTNLYKFHLDGLYDITLVASAKEYIIPYGTCVLNNFGDLDFIDEKPKYDFLINTGLYILNPEVLKLIPKHKFYNFTDLIDEARKCGKKVGVFPIDDEAWIDVGQWKEYKQALETM